MKRRFLAIRNTLRLLFDILPKFESINLRITELDVSLKRIEQIAASHPVPVKVNGTSNGHDVRRLQVLSKFSQLSGKAKEIELEWQRIQQDENDALCAFQTTLKEDNKQDYWHKRGIVEGIKWCVNHFC